MHESVDGEWSFTETLRHLAFATDAGLSRAIFGDLAPWHPLELPWDEMEDTPGIPRDRAARPSPDAVLKLRRDRTDGVREFLAGLTDETLAGDTKAGGRARMAAAAQLSGPRVPVDHPRRGVGTPPLRRARPWTS